nr:MFS transporter [Halovenus rubra]
MAGHVMVHTYELSIPILMTVWLVDFSVTSATLGTVVAVGYALFGIGALPGGILVDRFGSKTLITCCLLGMGVSFLLLSAVPGVAGITLALGIWGITASVYHPAGLALISNGVEQRGAAFAYHGMAGNIGIAGGPFLTAVLLITLDWRTAVVILAVPSLLTAVAGLSISFDERAAVDAVADGGDSSVSITSVREFVTASKRLFTVGFLTVLVLFNGLYYRGMLTFLPELLSGFLDTLLDTAPENGIGPIPDGPVASEFDLSQYLYAGLLAVGIVGQYIGGLLTDRIRSEYGLAGMLSLLVVIALLFVPASNRLSMLVLVSVALGFTLFAMQPLSQATIAKYSPPEHRGLSFGYTYFAIFGVGALGASLVGTAVTYGSVSTVFGLLASFAGIALALAGILIVYDS